MRKYGQTILEYKKPADMNLKDYKMSKHIVEDRKPRLKAIKEIEKLHNVPALKALDYFFVIDDLRSSINGKCADTIDVITMGGLIVKLSTDGRKTIITFLIARPEQVELYYESIGKKAPEWLINICQKNKERGFNKL